MELRTVSFHFRHRPALSSCDSDDQGFILPPRLAHLCSPTPSLLLNPHSYLVPVAQALLPITRILKPDFKTNRSCSLPAGRGQCPPEYVNHNVNQSLFLCLYKPHA
jgi:hypothetical protein